MPPSGGAIDGYVSLTNKLNPLSTVPSDWNQAVGSCAYIDEDTFRLSAQWDSKRPSSNTEGNITPLDISPLNPSSDYWLSVRIESDGVETSLWTTDPSPTADVGTPVATVKASSTPTSPDDGLGYDDVLNSNKAANILRVITEEAPTDYYGLTWNPKE